MRFSSVKKKAKNIEDFLERYVYISRSGEIKNIPYPATFWTKKGRQKIVRKICGRLKKMLYGKGYNLSYQITLTYRSFADYQRGDLRKFLNSFFRPFRYRNIEYKYFWMAEMQKRGVVHYHILVFVKRNQRSMFFSYFNVERIRKLWGKGYVFITVSYKTLKKAYNYAMKYLVKTIKNDDDFYLELVAFFRDAFGSFRMYGMSQIKRWGKFRRKWLEQMTRAALQYDFSEPVKILESVALEKVLRWCPWLIGYAERRTGKICHRKRDFPPFYFDKGVDKILLDVYNRKKEEDKWLENFILRGF